MTRSLVVLIALVSVVTLKQLINTIYLYPLEVVSRYRDPQLQEGKTYLYVPKMN